MHEEFKIITQWMIIFFNWFQYVSMKLTYSKYETENQNKIEHLLKRKMKSLTGENFKILKNNLLISGNVKNHREIDGK